MPIIAMFLGIVIRINFLDHAPPHLHAAHGGDEALFDLRTGRVIAGAIGREQTRRVVEWIERHRTELLYNWGLASTGQPTFKIEGLEE